MNFYDILDISPTATKNDIKRAYHKLAVLHHPDKSKELNSTEKFQEIQAAYEILSDDVKRKEYDSMSNEERLQVFDLIKQYFTDIRPQYQHIYDSIINFIYAEKEEDFKEDINNFKIRNIFSKIFAKIKDRTKIKDKKEYVEIRESNYTLVVTLKERYESLFKYAKIINSEAVNEYIIPIYENKFIINDPIKGIVQIDIITDNDKNYSPLNDYDLLYIKKVSLCQYLYGGKIKLILLNGEHIMFEFDSCLEKKPIFILENKGLPKINNNIETRGVLYIYLTIEGVNSIAEDDISKTYSTVIEDTIKLMFPPIE